MENSPATVSAPARPEEPGRHGAASAGPSGGREWLIATVSLVLAGAVMFSRRLIPDTLYDLYAGRYVVQHGMPHHNLITAAAHGAPWIDQQWLGQVVYYLAWRAGGYPLLAGLSAVLVAAGFALLMMAMLKRAVPPTRALAWTCAAFLICLWNISIRVQSFSYLLLAATIWLLVQDSRAARPRPRTLLVIAVLVLWANIHGSALLGAALVITYAACRAATARRDRVAFLGYLGLGTAAALAIVCTPYGLSTIGYYHRFIGNVELSRYIMEWAPPNVHSPQSLAFFAALPVIAIAIAIGWRRGGRPDPVLAGFTVILLAAAASAARNEAWFGFGGSLLAADTLARASARRVPALAVTFSRAVAGALAVLAAASLVTLAVRTDGQFYGQIPRPAVSAAAALAARDSSLTILGDEATATAMLWLHPELTGRVGFDVRFEVYSQRQLSGYFDFLTLSGPRWQRAAAGFGIIAASSLHPGLIAALGKLTGWRVAYRGGHGIVLVRRPIRA